ncbi:MAG: hypothetical protein K6E72_08340 [Saccharofermentans sp.]|nr:hypothetical protein [Saccharofermentans sp.]
MAFCKKCGALLPFANGVCSKCGTQAHTGYQGKNKLEFSSGNSGFTKSVLVNQLESYLQLLIDNEELQSMIKPQSNFPSMPTTYKKRSFMKFFWPFLVGGLVGGYGVYFLATFIIAYNAATSSQMYTNSQAASASMLGDTFAGFIIALIVAAVIIFFGVKVSKRKQEDFNRNADLMNQEAEARYNAGINNQKMLDLFQSNLNEMRKYEPLIPYEYRNPSHVGAIIDLIKEDKAQTIEEAIAML